MAHHRIGILVAGRELVDHAGELVVGLAIDAQRPVAPLPEEFGRGVNHAHIAREHQRLPERRVDDVFEANVRHHVDDALAALPAEDLSQRLALHFQLVVLHDRSGVPEVLAELSG